MYELLNFKNPVHSAAALSVCAKFYPNWSNRRRMDVCFAILQMNTNRPEIILAELNAQPAIETVTTVGQFAILFDMMLETSVTSIERCVSSLASWEDEKAITPSYHLPASFDGFTLRLNDLGNLQSLYSPFVFQTLPEQAFVEFHNCKIDKPSDIDLKVHFVEGLEESLNSCRVYLEDDKVESFTVEDSGVLLLMVSGNKELVTLDDMLNAKLGLEGFTSILYLPTSNLYVK
ncbi:hypothetical protein [Vibrio owensii]|uniref:hypothetical protein n=1 Tax=Vibrio owensii TaxID=696485 RepID=UPI0018F22C5A|nr:hypothetical protein [Vibrio owensii]